MSRNGYRHVVGALSLAILLGTPLAFSQSAEKAQPKPMMQKMMEQKAESQETHGDMPAKCKAMMQKRQQMMQKCQKMDAKLETLAAAMNTATGQKKIEAMAVLVNELVQQRKAMHQMMMMQMKGMMSGMMRGMSKDAKHKCKMMQKMMEKHNKPAPVSETGGSGK
ncbi:MAG: hypothetical protein GXP48_10040 [Acidobacteria bacterium]|nr:hypothetical protein [Acidobacteriota bacterium]